MNPFDLLKAYAATRWRAVCLLGIFMLPSCVVFGVDPPVRVFIFAGQSNMVGSDSKVKDIQRFPPFAGLDQPQPEVRFAYCIGRENKVRSDGWEALAPVNDVVGPELSFARELRRQLDVPVAIIKVAAGGTHLGGDWNPDDPQGFKMYPLALEVVRKSLEDLEQQGVPYRIEGFVWHQGENDMFQPEYMDNYGPNLKRYLECWRRDLEQPELDFYVGELCTKTIWGMDLRPRMAAIAKGQRWVTEQDPHAHYVPTSHVGVEIGGGVGLHYHYGTLGQLEHGVNHAWAYLAQQGIKRETPQSIDPWPYPGQEPVQLFVLAGHRNMEGERAFIQQLAESLREPQSEIAYFQSIGGGYRVSPDWVALAPSGYYDSFGPELSFARRLRQAGIQRIAIAKFTHSGSQMIDWTPQGSEVEARHLYPEFIQFIRQRKASLEQHGHPVELAGIFYHLGENDMSFMPYRKQAAQRLGELIRQSRIDLEDPKLRWYVSQQPPTSDERVARHDVVADIAKLAQDDPQLIHLTQLKLPKQEKQLVLDTAGVVALGKALAEGYLKDRKVDQ